MFADAATAAEAIAADRWHAAKGSRPNGRMGSSKNGSKAFGPKMAEMQQAGYQDPWASQNLHAQGYAPCAVQWYQPVPVVMTGMVPSMPLRDPPQSETQNPPPGKANPPSGPVQSVWSVDPVSVEVVGLPPALCTNMFMEAMLDQAGLEHCVLGYEVNPQGQRGHATIRLCTPEAAVACVAHFHGHRCAQQNRHAVMAYIVESNDKSKSKSTENPGDDDICQDTTSGQSESTASGDDTEDAKSDKTDSESAQSKEAMKLSMSPRIPSELRLPALSATPTSCKSNKPRWADLDDEGDGEDSTSAGTPSGDELGDSPFFSPSSPESSFMVASLPLLQP